MFTKINRPSRNVLSVLTLLTVSIASASAQTPTESTRPANKGADAVSSPADVSLDKLLRSERSDAGNPDGAGESSQRGSQASPARVSDGSSNEAPD
ncbi:MAG: hypothetical protein AAGD07_19465, partial [Planctomycetota bacterium]